MSRYRQITISIANDELNALEDIIVMDFKGDKEKEAKYRRKSLNVWCRLCKEWDKPKKSKKLHRSGFELD